MTDHPVRWEMLPSTPGFVLWWLAADREPQDIPDGDVLFHPTPIIGWRIEERRSQQGKSYFVTCPVTPADDPEGYDQDYVIQHPDGVFVFPGGQRAETLEAAIAQARSLR